MWQDHLVFPDVPGEFWQRFSECWTKPLRLLEEIISISESLGIDPTSSTFGAKDEMYWLALRSLHSRTCLNARSVLALLSFGLVDPALAHWRICHESATIASFIATFPEMASRYLQFSPVSRSRLVKELQDTGDEWILDTSEIDEIQDKAKDVREQLKETYDVPRSAGNYAWSGLGSFAEIEDMVFQGEKWKPRLDYLLASQLIHSAPNAGAPPVMRDGLPIFPVEPVESGLSGPIVLTSISIDQVTKALMQNAPRPTEDRTKTNDLEAKCLTVAPMSWEADPLNFCQDCSGYKPFAAPPDYVLLSEGQIPCSCQ